MPKFFFYKKRREKNYRRTTPSVPGWALCVLWSGRPHPCHLPQPPPRAGQSHAPGTWSPSSTPWLSAHSQLPADSSGLPAPASRSPPSLSGVLSRALDTCPLPSHPIFPSPAKKRLPQPVGVWLGGSFPLPHPRPYPHPCLLALLVQILVPNHPPISVPALVDSGASDSFLDPSIL